MEREYRYDNIKALLIFMVVLGHMLENCLVGSLRTIYIIIYSFHMPMFVFISGMFSKFEPNKIVRKLVVPYVVFQTLSFLLNMGNGTLQYTTPIWSLWYLMALIVWRLLVPFIDQEKRWVRIVILAGSVILALVVGFDDTVGYYMSLSRIIVFFPFFILGFYWRKYQRGRKLFEKIKKEYAVIALVAVCTMICFISDKVDPRWLYGSYSYEKAGYTPGCRLLF
ncbi:MAG: acyltransferase family protein, partial [Agathobacter sp.]